MRYKTVQLPEEMVEHVRETITSRKELGYVSVKGFVEDSVRRRLEAIERKREVKCAEDLAALLREEGLSDRAITKILEWYDTEIIAIEGKLEAAHV